MTNSAQAENDERFSCPEQKISCKIEGKGIASPAGEMAGRKRDNQKEKQDSQGKKQDNQKETGQSERNGTTQKETGQPEKAGQKGRKMEDKR